MFSETYGVTSYGSGWRMDVVNGFLEFVIDLNMIPLSSSYRKRAQLLDLGHENCVLPTPS